ncbi:ATP-binding protein [Phenylobacterium sp.]|jgi:signal transduction histidine kinase/ActR/RegA family two-component response regulator|uniref:ATP-binding protein n=1 Tax=Phenylobacterium sp. TaxID=1871053 RepID=UPI002F3EC574
MSEPSWLNSRARAARAMSDAGLSAYQLTLSGLVQRMPFHLVVNGLTGLAMALIGHAAMGLIAFLAFTGFDAVHLVFVNRWRAAAERTPDGEGFRKIAFASLIRTTIYVAPATVLAVQGGRAELLLFAVQATTLIAVSMSCSMTSRFVFWALATPVLIAMGAVGAAAAGPGNAAGLLLIQAVLVLLLGLMMEGITRTVHVLHKAFNQNVALIPQLETARDQALAERAAADEARETARQAGRAKSNFLATMSHEIRTPMNGVLGMAQLMRRDETNPVQQARLDVLIESGDYLLSILNDILDVSKIDAGRLDIHPAPEDLKQFLQRLVGFWGPRADEKGVAIELEIAQGAPDFVLVDALRLRQVLFNLMGNALKFTDKGAVTVAVDAMPNGEGAVLLHVAVRDTGIGIAPEHLPQLFTRFTQADESEMRKFGGTGLGLSIAKQLVELMGGRIWAESVVGEGSAFQFKLPLALAQGPAEPKAGSAPAGAAAEPMDGLRMLAVDDNAVNLLVLEQLLTSFGHQVAKASSGAEALEALAGEAFDLVLLDIQMPGMTGVEVLQRLRAADGPNRHAPVVALTADVTSGGRQRYLDLGFTEHSSKPIQIQDLVEAIGRAMAAPAAKREAA